MAEPAENEYADEAHLVGRTITRVRFWDTAPGEDWGHHEQCWLWLDDGRVIEFSSYGHDADGCTMEEIEVTSGLCGHCGIQHPAHIWEENGQRYYYCGHDKVLLN